MRPDIPANQVIEKMTEMQGAQAVHQGTRKMSAKDFELQVLSRWDDLRIRTVFNQNMREWGYIDPVRNAQQLELSSNAALMEKLLTTPLALFATAVEQTLKQGCSSNEVAQRFDNAQQALAALWHSEFERRQHKKVRLLPMLLQS